MAKEREGNKRFDEEIKDCVGK